MQACRWITFMIKQIWSSWLPLSRSLHQSVLSLQMDHNICIFCLVPLNLQWHFKVLAKYFCRIRWGLINGSTFLYSTDVCSMSNNLQVPCIFLCRIWSNLALSHKFPETLKIIWCKGIRRINLFSETRIESFFFQSLKDSPKEICQTVSTLWSPAAKRLQKLQRSPRGQF